MPPNSDTSAADDDADNVISFPPSIASDPALQSTSSRERVVKKDGQIYKKQFGLTSKDLKISLIIMNITKMMIFSQSIEKHTSIFFK